MIPLSQANQCGSAGTVKGRFAPSPSGRMHLGNIFTALMSWLSAKSRGGSWLLRIEDLDPQRSRPEYARLIEDDLRWLGLSWDEGGTEGLGFAGPYVQSERSPLYADALARLEASGDTFECFCTRAEIMATQAPHQSDGRIVYPGTCRNLTRRPDRKGAIRLKVANEKICFTDMIAGPCSFNLAHECGDFILRRADGAWAYQLAVVVDDAAMGVTEVMRGNDLLLSAAQQIWLYRRLGLTPPAFAHIPLICNAAGQRLSKRDSSMSMEALRSRFDPEDIIGYLAWISRLIPDPRPCTATGLIPHFCIDRLSVMPHEIRVDKSIEAFKTLYS